MRGTFITFLFIFIFCLSASGKSKIVEDFTPVCDSLSTLIFERSGIKGPVKLKTVMKRGSGLDFYFTESLGDFPWHKEDVRWLRLTLKKLFPEEYSRYKVGEIYSRKVSIDRLATPHLSYDGKPADSRHKVKSPADGGMMVKKVGGLKSGKGLSGRHIALWQSHGRYYDQTAEKWTWQRPCLFRTCEDMFTQGFVLPYLVPMLENAGAYVLLPRERDIQVNEIIADNDPTAGGRGTATYSETGRWEDAGSGFADLKPTYEGIENPFANGTARKASCVGHNSKVTATVCWTPEIPERGEYAVYVSYKSLPSSTSAAHYTVSHLGGTSEFIVNQKMGGGTWVYLGTFEFAKGGSSYVSLDNRTPEGHRMEVGAIVTADAVRFGGGMGNIARKTWTDLQDTSSVEIPAEVSGMPRYAEAARYWLQWAGADTTIFHQNEGKNDYRDDFMSRGDWVEWISRGSRTNPSKADGPGIPVDLSFGFHTDAGITPNDSLVGTLAIYTYKSGGKTSLPSGEDRLTSRLYADIVQQQIVNDLRASHDSLWSRRHIWDRGYRESRTPSSPAMLLELLSHQNFADMKYGLDPTFRFDVSRAVYKGMLKYLSTRYGHDYVVQPLPVEDMGVSFGKSGKAVISWKPVEDSLEPTASAKGYILYSRIGDGGFDTGRIIEKVKHHDGRYYTEVDLQAGKVMSYRICAFNDGGISFPSETVSIGTPAGTVHRPVLVVNNFDRISGPAYIDTPEYAGFEDRSDSGVPYMQDITFVGEMHNFRRSDKWITNERPGFGASYSDMAGEIVAGNTFDFASVHGKAILGAGHAFYSCSNERFSSDSTFAAQAWSVDLICGKQVTTALGMQQKYPVFSREMQDALRRFALKGGNILVSGSYIGTDIWDRIYPVQVDSTFRSESIAFAKDILGYKYAAGKASGRGSVNPSRNPAIQNLPSVRIVMEKNPDIYCVESPDGIAPASKSASGIYRYADSGISAGVAFEGKGYRCVSLGFPIETLECSDSVQNLMDCILKYFTFAQAEIR